MRLRSGRLLQGRSPAVTHVVVTRHAFLRGGRRAKEAGQLMSNAAVPLLALVELERGWVLEDSSAWRLLSLLLFCISW